MRHALLAAALSLVTVAPAWAGAFVDYRTGEGHTLGEPHKCVAISDRAKMTAEEKGRFARRVAEAAEEKDHRPVSIKRCWAL